MARVAGFVFFEEEFFSSIKDNPEKYQEFFLNIFLPRIVASKKVTDFFIIQPSDTKIIVTKKEVENTARITFKKCESLDIISELIHICESAGITHACIISPSELLVSPDEIDTLVNDHLTSNNVYSCNTPSYCNEARSQNRCIQVIDVVYLKKIKQQYPAYYQWNDPDTRNLLDPCIINFVPCKSQSSPEINLSFFDKNSFLKIARVIENLKKHSNDPLWDTDLIFKTYRDVHQTKAVILIERSQEIDAAIRWSQTSGGFTRIIALYPDIAYTLKTRGIPFSIMDNFYDVQYVNRFVFEKSQKIEEFCESLDAQIRIKTSDDSVKPAYGSFSHLRILHDVLLTHAMIIRNIIKKNNPDIIMLFTGYPVDDCSSQGIPYSRDESVYSHVLQSQNWDIPVKIISSCQSNIRYTGIDLNTAFLGFILSSVKTAIRRNNFLFNLGIMIKHHGWRTIPFAFTSIPLSRLKNPKTTNVLLYGGGYNWDDCTHELLRSGIHRIIRIDDSVIESEYHPAEYETMDHFDFIFNACKNTELVLEISRNEGIGISRFFCYRAANLIARSYNISRFTRDKIISIHNKTPIHCLLLSSRSTEIAKTIVHTSRELHIPVISWQHGGTGYGYDPMMYHDEIFGSDVHFVFGNCVADQYKKICRQYPKESCAIIPIGSSSLDNLKIPLRSIQKPTTILLITSYYHKNDHNVIYLNRSSPNEALWEIHESFLNLAKRHPECAFIIKLHPLSRSREPLEGFVTDNQIANVQLIVDEKSVSELLYESDIIFLDTISTGILQALTTDKEIFVYTGIYMIEKQAIECLKKRAYISETPEEFFYQLDNFLIHGKELNATIDVCNTDFLRCYGTYKNDGLSCRRAIDVVWNVMNKR